MKHRIEWRWDDALRAAICLVPATIVMVNGDISKGIAFAVGILPACLLGIAPNRRNRIMSVIPGVLFALFLVVGSLLALQGVLAVVGIFVACLGSGFLAASRPTLGRLFLSLLVPAIAVGLSCKPEIAVGLAIVITAGSVWSILVALAWPTETPKHGLPKATPPTMTESLVYGTLLGLAASLSVVAGLILNVSHLGWAAAAATLVMRPDPNALRVRGTGRVFAVLGGAFLALVVLRLDIGNSLLAVIVTVVAVATIATRTSYWYMTSAGTTFMVLTMIFSATTESNVVASLFWERIYETFIGVGLAYMFGVVIRKWAHQVARNRGIPVRP